MKRFSFRSLTFLLTTAFFVSACASLASNPSQNDLSKIIPIDNSKVENASFKLIGSDVQKINGGSSGLLAVKTNHKLMQFKTLNEWVEVAKDVSLTGPILDSRGRISYVDKNGHYEMLQGQQVYKSNIEVALKSSFVHLGAASIAVIKDQNNYKLARIHANGSNLSVANKRESPVLKEDAKPVQVNFNSLNDDDNGHVAVLANPTTDYSHYILGNSANFKSLLYVERHNMNDNLAGVLDLPDKTVFEDNELRIVTWNNQRHLMVVESNLNGAQIKFYRVNNGKWEVSKTLVATTQANRWVSLLGVFGNHLYATITPHLGSGTRFVQYNLTQNNSEPENLLLGQVSTHSIGNSQAATFGQLGQFLFLPSINSQNLIAYNIQEQKIAKNFSFKQKIKDIKTVNGQVFILLTNNELYTINLS